MTLRSMSAVLVPLAWVAGAACSRSPGPAQPASVASAMTPEPVVVAERAFASDGLALGFKGSFLKHSSDDAIVIQPEPVNAHEVLAAAPDPAPGDNRPALVWWPLWAGISRSGDLGFTTGPFAVGGKRLGHYFTVWKKQPDGGWKWVFDGGVGADPAAEPAAGAPVGYLAIATAGSSSPEAASAEVRAAEQELARRAATDLAGAYAPYLADDGHVHTEGLPPARTRASFAGALTARAPAMELSPLGGGASAAGDLVWTYGDARWTAGAAPQRGHYVRMWQKRTGGWRIVFDELVPFRGPPPAPAPAAGG